MTQHRETEAVPMSVESLPKGPELPDAQQAQFVNFAREETVHKSGGKVYGNWSTSFSGACIAAFPGYIEEGAITDLSRVGNCSTGSAVLRARSN